jgi:hypothetical protein
MRRFLLIGFIFGTSLSASIAQTTSCTQTLRLARSTYDQGRLHEIPSLLENCLKNGLTTQEKVEAYKILCLTYLYLEEPEKADEAMLKLLRTDPYFEVNKQVDPAEFIALYSTFRTQPIYRLGINIGVNATQPNVASSIKTNAGENKYEYGVAFQVGVNGEIPMWKKFTLNPSLIFQQKNFSFTSTIDRGTDATGTTLTNQTTGKEVQTWISLPVMMQYNVMPGRYNPYVSLGVSADYLVKADITAQTVQDNAGSVQERTYKMEREKINISVLLGAGAKFRIFGGYFITELRYHYGVTKVNSDQTYYQNTATAFNNNLGDPLFKLSSLSITAGYVQNIFNPKKLKRK